VEAAVSAGPRIRPRLVAIWLVLLALVGIIVVLELQDRAEERSAGSQPVRDPRLLLPVSIDEIGALEVMYQGTVHRFERDDKGAWFYHGMHAPAQGAHAHQTDPAAAARIEKALAGFGRARMERFFPLQDGGKELGVAAPQMVILAYRGKNPTPLIQIAVGDIAPDKLSRYVLPVGKAEVVSIANYQIDNLTSLIDAMNKPQAAGAPAPQGKPAGQ
jgi:hypothetical protein